VAGGVGLVIGSIAHAREPRGRARRRGVRRLDGQPEVRQDLLDGRPVLDRGQQALALPHERRCAFRAPALRAVLRSSA
jgi:hypothetical protein